MFGPDLYRKTCSESLRLSEEKFEGMIVMTENKKRELHRPIQIALIAAALACVMCVTAAAANPEMVAQIWRSLSISVICEDENMVVIQADIPEISVKRMDERVILAVDNEQLDITEALERDGVFTLAFEGEKGTAEVTVQPDLTWGITMSMEGGNIASHHTNDEITADETTVIYTFTDDQSATNAIYLPLEER